MGLTLSSGSMPATGTWGGDGPWTNSGSLIIHLPEHLQKGVYRHLPSSAPAKQTYLFPPHGALKLTLLVHVKRMLQLQGYDVQRRMTAESLDVITPFYCLTASRANTYISIQLSYVLHPSYSFVRDIVFKSHIRERKPKLQADAKCTQKQSKFVSLCTTSNDYLHDIVKV